jgi:hypothetical protein
MIHYFKLRQSSLRLDNNFDKDFQISTHNSVLPIYFPIDVFNSPFSNILMVRITVSTRNPVKSQFVISQINRISVCIFWS